MLLLVGNYYFIPTRKITQKGFSYTCAVASKITCSKVNLLPSLQDGRRNTLISFNPTK